MSGQTFQLFNPSPFEKKYSMISYLFMRVFRWATGLLLIMFITYAMMFYGAGDPIKRMYLARDAGSGMDENVVDALREKFGLDKPFGAQFGNYMQNLVRGDMGYSIFMRRDVTDIVFARLPISIQLGLAATVLMTIIGIPLGVLAALNHNRWPDQLIVGVVVFFHAVPVFVVGPILLLIFVLALGLMDVPTGWKGLFHTQNILPLFVLLLGPMPVVVRQTRAAMLEVMRQDYIRTARAKGVPEKMVIVRHMLRPILTPVVTSIGLIMIGIINGALIVEKLFNIPGFGTLTLRGLQTVDYPIIMATVLVGAMIVMVSNLLVDFIYPLLDPRVTRS
ncbi:MAG: ABC transporter permease [Chloroflexota bacterium]